MPLQVAQTNVQLYNQLRERGLPLGDLVMVHRAYELLTTLYTGYFQVDGKPFVAHGVGVASILAELDQPAELLAAGLLHNVYGNADFGDGRSSSAHPARRRLVREAVGEQVERLVARFGELRVQHRPAAQTLATLPQRDETERRLMVVDLADFLEKHIDLGVLYAQHRWRKDLEQMEDDMLEVARTLEPRLADWLRAALARSASARAQIPAELRPSDGRPYAKLVTPRSCTRRLPVRAREGIRWLRSRVQLRGRVRALLSGITRRDPASDRRSRPR